MAPAFIITPEHETRELLNRLLLLDQCLRLPDATGAERDKWQSEFAETRQRIEDRFTAGRDSAILTRRLAASSLGALGLSSAFASDA